MKKIVPLACLVLLSAVCAEHARAADTGQTAAGYSRELALALLPVRLPPPAALPKRMAGLARAAAGSRPAQVCLNSQAQFDTLMRSAAGLFFGPDRRHGDPAAIEHFLDQHVRAKPAALELADEGFAAAAPWRAIIAVTCLRAGLAHVGLRLLGSAASASPGSATATAVAILHADRAQQWQAAAGHLPAAWPALHDLLILALADPAQSAAWLTKAAGAARTEDARQLVAKVRAAVAASGTK